MQSLGLIKTFVSGGQTGVDRAALDAANAAGVPHGGWCPKGRLAEDGAIAKHYNLRETETTKYDQRTRRNVRDSDGTLILHRGPLTGGTDLTWSYAKRRGKPALCVDLSEAYDVAVVRDWLVEHRIATLNVAGPRESTAPGIGAKARRFLDELLGPD